MNFFSTKAITGKRQSSLCA